MDNIFYVYELIDPFTNIPFYIGKGKGNRLYNHEKCIKNNRIPNNNKHLFNKIKEIHSKGGCVIYKKIIENLDENMSYLIESDQIKRIGRSDLKLGPLCNLTDGGEGTSGIDHSGSKNSMYGKNHSNKTKYIISEKRRNRIWNFKHSEQHKNKLKIYNPGGISTSHPILQLDLNGNIIKEWNSIRSAAKTLNLMAGTICNAIKKLITYKNYIWIYKKNHKEFKLSTIKIRDGVKNLDQIDINGNLIKTWKSISQACNELNMKPSTISISSKKHTLHKGYYWKIYE